MRPGSQGGMLSLLEHKKLTEKGGIALLVNREEEVGGGGGGVARSFDELATGLDTGAISRGRAMKLAGAALVASALGLVATREADAQLTEEGARNRCKRKGGDFCRRQGCHVCCQQNNKKACCGKNGCRCCKRHQNCKA